MILVTGGTGLVGAHLLYKLTLEHKKVRAIYRSKSKIENTKNVFSCYTKNYKNLFNTIEWIKADLVDVPALSKAFSNITKVYHCAALVSFEPHKFEMLRKVNIEGTANIVNLCISKSIKKLCYVSSIATLGNTINNKPITENTTWNPEDDNSVYAIAKYGAEMEVWRGTQEGLDAVIINPGVILGAGIWNYSSGNLFTKASNGFKYYTSGTIGLISIDDVIAIMISLMNSTIKNERFILVAENWTYKNFLIALTEAVNGKSPKKIANHTLLNIAWRLDWLKHKITRRKRVLTKQIVASLTTQTYYDSDKIKTALNYKFKAVNETIVSVGNQYLK